VPRPGTGISARSKALAPEPEGRDGAGVEETYAGRAYARLALGDELAELGWSKPEGPPERGE
jgi:hypothetical protein